MVKLYFRKFYHFLTSNFYFAYGGLTKTPSNSKSAISDLFLWRVDDYWKTRFELLDLKNLIDPTYKNSEISKVVFIFFDNFGKKVHEKNIEFSQFSRNPISLVDLLPIDLKGFGTFSCFHWVADNNFIAPETFIAERGYCGYSMNNCNNYSYVHGNLDAVAYDGNNIEMLGNFNKRSYIYNLQYIFCSNINYEIILINPTNQVQKCKFNFINCVSLNQEFFLEPRATLIKKVFFKSNKKVRLTVKSNLYMARPIIFRYHDNSLDVFHG